MGSRENFRVTGVGEEALSGQTTSPPAVGEHHRRRATDLKGVASSGSRWPVMHYREEKKC